MHVHISLIKSTKGWGSLDPRPSFVVKVLEDVVCEITGSDVIFHECGHGLGYAYALPWHSLERPQLTLERRAAGQLLQLESKVPLE